MTSMNNFRFLIEIFNISSVSKPHSYQIIEPLAPSLEVVKKCTARHSCDVFGYAMSVDLKPVKDGGF